MAEKPAEQKDPQKAYLSEKLNKVSGEIGEGYGEPLMDELMSVSYTHLTLPTILLV